jgi:nucleoporin POM34
MRLLTVHGSTTTVLSVSDVSNASWYSSVTLVLFRAVLFTNIILLLRPAIPYISKQDTFSDIPLTPSQRALLGLNPSTQSTPASAASGVHYITPPKYRRLSGSFSGTPSGGATTDRRSISANYSDSPLSTSRYTVGFSPTPHSIRRASGSPFSPSPTASPLFHKAVNQSSQQAPEIDFSASTQSLGLSTGNGLGRSQSLRERSRRDSLDPASPTPGTRSPQLVPGVNYKWLYEKGRKLPKSESFGSFGL